MIIKIERDNKIIKIIFHCHIGIDSGFTQFQIK